MILPRRLVFLALAAALVAASCGSIPLTDPKWSSRAGVQVLRLRWVKNLAPSLPNFYIPEMIEEHDRFRPVETGGAAFDTDKRRAFVGAAIGGLYCLDLRNGETLWRFSVDDPVGSTPLYDSARKRVYFGADDGLLYAVHARSGRLLWSTDTGAEVQRSVIMRDDTLYLANADNTVYAIDPNAGEVVWRYRKPPVEGFSATGYSDILHVGAAVIAAFADGTVSSLDAITGAQLWSSDLAAEVVSATKEGQINLIDADATPVVVDGILAAASVSGGLWGLDVDTGNVIWTRPDLVGITGLGATNGMFYAAFAGGKGMCAISRESGETEWCSAFGSGVLRDPLLYEDVFLVSDSEEGLIVVSTSSGKVLERLNPMGGFFSRPVEFGGYLIVMGNRSTVYTLSIL
ncbi:MAG: PQQ-binding-like beta-propeller repeat protein [Proteobacteria bacterium]|nr:PQQ-binding-like beta-propeller repeat protein [Pseudomonadota bacterium]